MQNQIQTGYACISYRRDWVGGKEPESSGDIYVFRCSLLQAYNYFFPFGKEAEILEPQRLRDRFIKGYNNGATKYQ